MTETQSLLQVRDVTLRFGGVAALTGVSFDVNHGEVFAVMGPNGAGKTSIFNCLYAVYRPQQGSTKLDGTDGTTITLGVVTPQTGVAAVVGNPLTNGNQTYFDRLNSEGGIAGSDAAEAFELE